MNYFNLKEKFFSNTKRVHIPVFMASDDNYAPYLAAAAYSILKNTKSHIDFYIMDGGITNKSKELIKASLKRFKNFSINYFNMSKYDLDRFPNIRHYSLNTFSRYFIPIIKPEIDKCLYLDVDIIVTGDIRELFDIELGNYALAAVPEDFYRKNGEYVKNNILTSFNNTIKYFNAGVLLLNNKKFVQNNYSEKLVNMTIKYFETLSCADQDILNILLEKDHLLIDYKYNYMPDFYNRYNNLIPGLGDRLEKDAIILHYTWHKPWKDDITRHKEEFWNIMKKTLFIKQVFENYRTFTNV